MSSVLSHSGRRLINPSNGFSSFSLGFLSMNNFSFPRSRLYQGYWYWRHWQICLFCLMTWSLCVVRLWLIRSFCFSYVFPIFSRYFLLRLHGTCCHVLAVFYHWWCLVFVQEGYYFFHWIRLNNFLCWAFRHICCSLVHYLTELCQIAPKLLRIFLKRNISV